MTTESQTIDPIDRIFKRLAGTYMSAWERMLGSTPIADIKTVWAHDLAGYLQSRDAMMHIAWALDNLPERPPNSRQFLALLRESPVEKTLALSAPAADPARMRAELAKLAPLQETDQAIASSREYRGAWARKIMAEHRAGIHKTPAQLTMARDGLKNLGLSEHVDNH